MKTEPLKPGYFAEHGTRKILALPWHPEQTQDPDGGGP